jgi:iron complex outermembrane receptor protein
VKIKQIIILMGGAAMCSAGVVLADDVPAPTSDAGAANGGEPLAEVMVTAQRRSERLQDVPISITALTAQNLQQSGVISVLDLPRISPGLELPQFGAWTQPSIRGISSGGADIGDSSNVAMYIDGVYQNSQVAQLLDLPDVQQIEVLKGPQGTLYGQNAEGGAIIITTLQPTFTSTGKVAVSYGNFDDISVRGYGSTGVTDKLAVSVAGSFEDRNGLRYNVATGDRDRGLRSSLVRAKLLYQATDDASFLLSGYYADRKDGAPFAGVPLDGNTVANGLYPDLPRPSNTQVSLSAPTDTANKVWGASLKSNLGFAYGELTSVTAYAATAFDLIADVDYSALNLAVSFERVNSRYFTEDLSFVSKGLGPVTLSSGLFFSKGHEASPNQTFAQYDATVATVAPDAPGPAVFLGALNKSIDKKVLAGFAEVAYEVIERLTVTGGARYTYEEQHAYSDLYSGGALIPGPYNPGIFKKLTPRATARYALDPTSNVYVSWGKGFKSGLVGSDNLYSPPVRPEELTSYEVGYKGQVMDAVKINAAVFHYTFKDIQVQRFLAPLTVYQNAAAAHLTGFDFDTAFRVTQELSLTVGGVYLDSKYTSYPEAGVFIPIAGGGNENANIDASGKPLIRAPKFTGNVGVNYKRSTSLGEFEGFLSTYYNSGESLEASGRVHQGGYAQIDAELSYSPTAYDKVRLSLWGRNLTDKQFIQGTLLTTFADGVTYSTPRTFGVRGEYKF